ncbi:MAG: hypothetical protein K7J46_01485 [Bryobacter sp.]|nr:hypothetical protein [Bryobacter sp. CoA8 C33]
MAETAIPHRIEPNWRGLAAFALGGLIATEILRRLVPAPPAAQGWQLVYWLTDRVFFDGKWLVLCALALAPWREGLPLRVIGPGAGLVLMLGSFLQLADPLFLIVVGLLAGLVVKGIRHTEPALMLMAMGGLLMGVPVNGFTALMAAKAKFPAPLMAALFGSTAGVGCVSIAVSFSAFFHLAALLWRRLGGRYR